MVAEPEPFVAEKAWARSLAGLGKLERVFVSDNAVFGGFDAGVVRVSVRRDLWRDRVYEALSKLDLGAIYPGFRRIEVTVAEVGGQTGREKWSALTDAARTDARREAERAPALRRLMELMSAELDTVEPILDGVRDTAEVQEEVSDE